MVSGPIAIDLFCGLGGWTEGLQAEGYRVFGFDNERHAYGEAKYPAQWVLQDALTIHGRQFKSAALIVASPPCQEYSYMAMPWSIAKQKAREYRDGTRDVRQLTALFDACFRIQREASEAAGRYIPLVVENVCGAQKWVGRARWHYGSFYLWGDVPALMPVSFGSGVLGGNAKDYHGDVGSDQKHAGSIKNGGDWFGSGSDCSLQRRAGSKSTARKAASAHIAKIPYELARHIGRSWKPEEGQNARCL